MNSGDWIENLTSLEYTDGKWTVYKYMEDPVAQAIDIEKKKQAKETSKELMVSLMQELNMVKGNINGGISDIADSMEAA
jgi:hypothetical protein